MVDDAEVKEQLELAERVGRELVRLGLRSTSNIYVGSRWWTTPR